MKRFMVISNHTGEECVRAYKETLAIGYLTHYDWGCKDGVHTGWALIEAENKPQAMMSVPTFLRSKALVVELTRYSPELVEAMHSK